MNSFKHFNRFLVASLLLAGQMFSVQAYNKECVNKEIARLIQNQGDVSQLNLSSCNITSKDLLPILDSIDRKLRGNIKTLSLWNNQLTSLPNGFSTSVPNVEILYLSRNKLGAYPNTLLNIPRKVKDLCLMNNNLSKIPQKAFTRLENLQDLNISYNTNLKADFILLNELSSLQCNINIEETEISNQIKNFFNQRISEKKASTQNTQDQAIQHFLLSFKNNERQLEISNGLDVKLLIKYHVKIENLQDKNNQMQKILNEIENRNEAIRTLCSTLFENFKNNEAGLK